MSHNSESKRRDVVPVAELPEEVRRKYDDADKAADFAVDLVNQVVEGFSDLKLAVHLCRRAGARARAA